MTLIFSAEWFVLAAIVLLIFAAICWSGNSFLNKVIKLVYFLAVAYGIAVYLFLIGVVVKV